LVSFYLEHNPWVRDVEEMKYWFNPMYFTWLYYKHPKRWIKWTATFSFISAIIIVAIITPVWYGTSDYSILITRMSQETFFKGFIPGSALAALIILALYPFLRNMLLSKS